MPTVVNTSGVKAGSIYKIKVVNFVTYKEVELYPGLYLNMIIGPNGTGKSTFVCALILGLCGNIASIGRAKKISEYVRSGCEEASIEIELYQQRGKENVRITRVFNRKDVSKWYINNQPKSLQDVKALIDTFKIKVDNLCQMLPQDRVKDFACMSPQILLQSTLLAIGQQKRITELEELKNWRTELNSFTSKLEKIEKKKQDLTNENERLQKVVENIKTRKEIVNEIKVCDCKKLWLEEAIARKDRQKYDKDIEAATKLIATNEKKFKLLEESLKHVKEEIKQLENAKRAINSTINDFKDKKSNSLSTVKIQLDNIKEAHSRYLLKEKESLKELNDLETAKAELDRLRGDLIHVTKQYGDESQKKSELANVRIQMNDLKKKKIALIKQREEIVHDYIHNLFPNTTRFQNTINKLENVDKKRLQTLQDFSVDTYNALVWLRANKDSFVHPFCEPMMLEIRFPDSRYARYLESTVARRDLIAFTFSNSNDMNKFITTVRGKLNLKEVNAVCSPPVDTTYTTPDISAIRRFGFQTYLLDTFEANEMIVRYLCRTYNVHRIPIGNDYTYNNSGSVDANITLFFSDKHRFAVKVSKYSGDKLTSVNPIQEPFLLAATVDVDQINQQKKELSKLEKEIQEYEAKKREMNTREAALDSEYNTYATKETKLHEHTHLVNRLSLKIELKAKFVQEKSIPSLDMQEEKKKCVETQRECVFKQVRLHCELVELMANKHKQCLLYGVVSLALKKKRSSIVDQEKQLFELKRKLSESQERLHSIRQSQEQVIQIADAKRKEAFRSSNNREPGHPQFPNRDLYERLPDDLPRLEQHCIVLRTSIECMRSENDGDLQKYENNKKEIEQLELDKIATTKDIEKLKKSMITTKAKWIEFMNNLISDINQRFRDMFTKLDFVGEVRLKRGSSEDDFSLYGLAIMVKFRPGEPLCELSPVKQSGGERSISTAVYLLALQHFAHAPFRCVDEINQGMDLNNERKMFEFLVDVTTKGEGGQYFLLTPKLLTGLSYNEKVTVHTIMNGRGALDCNQWQMNKFVANLRSYKQAM